MEDEKQYLSASEMAKRWNLSVRRVRYLCAKHWVFRAFRDKNTGEWKIPSAAERPVDRRRYRYRKVPQHFQDLVQHVDVAVDEVKAHPQQSKEESWRFFVRGSAFHLHQLDTSSLSFRDVCDVIDGKDVHGKDEQDIILVLTHVMTLELVRKAVLNKRRLSMTLVREFARSLNFDVRVRCENWMKCQELTELIRKLAQSDAHPLIKAGDALEGLFWLKPIECHSERLGYMLANFILMREGYPPAIIFRIVFKTLLQYWQEHFRRVDEYYKRKEEALYCPHAPAVLEGKPLKPAKFRAFLCGCVCKSVLRSARLGIGPCC